MRKVILALAILCTIFSSCRKTPDFSQLSSQFVVTTNYDKQANFGEYKTFYISDTVANLGGKDADSVLTGDGAQKAIKAVTDNLTARGYVWTARENNPDLGVTVSVVKNLNVDVVYWGWWDGYPGYWDPWYWGWYYPYYYPYPYTSVYAYTTGTVITNIIDLKNAVKNQALTVVWNSDGFGAVGSDLNTNIQLGINAINQGFAQSPYLKTN
ncbi:DUF4136 domain-containing protein [Deminuibacter soli]|uniref:DUF4136 domain-containing protein n=1 Tax=Deminuibacter soli TaxID=2291815 RepID=A0A3E1NH73_9BACT|nr:DUF4136 domain-containing protein [Deminuibacter soli]RFM27299.1 DUF4136 domain-containing protein [Deminuibacter soli]